MKFTTTGGTLTIKGDFTMNRTGNDIVITASKKTAAKKATAKSNVTKNDVYKTLTAKVTKARKATTAKKRVGRPRKVQA